MRKIYQDGLNFVFRIFLIIQFFVLTAYAKTPADPSQLAKGFQHILIDIRNSRGGYGDVASGLLTARDFLDRLEHPGPISIMTDVTSLRLLAEILHENIQPGGTALNGRLQIYDVAVPPPYSKPVDLYLHLARPNSELTFKNDFEVTSKRAAIIPNNNRTVIMNLPVLGNSENNNYADPFGSVRIAGNQFELQSPGLRQHESGVYFDTSAAEYAALDDKSARARLLQSIAAMPDTNPNKSRLASLVSQASLLDSQLALAYGTRRDEQMNSFISYMRGLRDRHPNESFVFVHPLDLVITQIPKDLRSSIIILNSGDTFPTRPLPGHIYVFNCGPIPQDVFNGLMRISQIPPLIAGDGAVSAAITMQRNFVMTEVP